LILLGYVLLTLLPVAAGIYLVWFYRKKRAERAAASSKRFAEMFGPGITPRPGATATRSTQTAPSGTPAPVPAALCSRKDRLLTGQHAALFQGLTAALPDCLIFPQVSLAALVELPPAVQGREREQRQRGIALLTLDFVVCDEHTRAVAAVDLQDAPSAESQFKSEYLEGAQLRYLRVSPASLPDPDALRSLVLGVADRKPG
jgi:hypothetical protein